MKRKISIFAVSICIFLLIFLSSCSDSLNFNNMPIETQNKSFWGNISGRPTDIRTGIIGYWTDDVQKNALYFGADGKFRFYELYNNELYEEYWEFDWYFKDDNTVVFTDEVDGEKVYEEHNVKLRDGKLYVSDLGESLNYSGSKVPEICFYDTFLKYVPRGFYSHDSFGDKYALEIAWGDLIIYENLPYDTPRQTYYFHLDSADSTVAYCTLNSGEQFTMRIDRWSNIVVTIGNRAYELHNIPYPEMIRNEIPNDMIYEMPNELRSEMSLLLSSNPEKNISLSEAESIHTGMILNDVMDIIGRPQRICGTSCSNILEWDLSNGKYMRILFQTYDLDSSSNINGVKDFKVSSTYIGNAEELNTYHVKRFSEDFGSVFRETPEKIVTKNDISRLHPLMTLGEVVDIIGHPQRDMGSGFHIFEWDALDGETICINVSINLENIYDSIVWTALMEK